MSLRVFPGKDGCAACAKGRIHRQPQLWQVYCIILQRTLLEFLARLLVVLSEML
jgi:hypothetical protein